ncbi:MAG: hypothetical protein AABW87_01605 [Nanoarchaeota archaeon]
MDYMVGIARDFEKLRELDPGNDLLIYGHISDGVFVVSEDSQIKDKFLKRFREGASVTAVYFKYFVTLEKAIEDRKPKEQPKAVIPASKKPHERRTLKELVQILLGR